jgi:hypothetical protein
MPRYRISEGRSSGGSLSGEKFHWTEKKAKQNKTKKTKTKKNNPKQSKPKKKSLTFQQDFCPTHVKIGFGLARRGTTARAGQFSITSRRQ